jgi:hypothetical protein
VKIAREDMSPDYEVRLAAKGIEARARIQTEGAPQAISAIVPIAGGLIDTTEKRALLPVMGEVTIEGRRFSLDGGLAGYDYTNGLFARRTSWRWAFALGRARSGQRVALNLVEGFTGDAECGLWVDGELLPLAEGSFEFDRENPLSPWRVGTKDGIVDLRFDPIGMHAEERDYKLVSSRFYQPAGTYSGHIRVPGGPELELDSVLGVTEDQDMLW